jgi:hypothetical protein
MMPLLFGARAGSRGWLALRPIGLADILSHRLTIDASSAMPLGPGCAEYMVTVARHERKVLLSLQSATPQLAVAAEQSLRPLTHIVFLSVSGRQTSRSDRG